MKHIPYFVLALVILYGFTFLPGGGVKHGPLLVIDTANSNFGAVPDTGYAVRTFTLSNGGDSVLRILKVQPTCGCTIASLEDSTLTPGKRTELKVRLSAANRSGNFNKDIYITSNSRDAASTWLKFYGHFVADNSEKAQR